MYFFLLWTNSCAKFLSCTCRQTQGYLVCLWASHTLVSWFEYMNKPSEALGAIKRAGQAWNQSARPRRLHPTVSPWPWLFHGQHHQQELVVKNEVLIWHHFLGLGQGQEGLIKVLGWFCPKTWPNWGAELFPLGYFPAFLPKLFSNNFCWCLISIKSHHPLAFLPPNPPGRVFVSTLVSRRYNASCLDVDIVINVCRS